MKRINHVVGTKISVLESNRQTYESLIQLLKRKEIGFITVNNVHTIIEALQINSYR